MKSLHKKIIIGALAGAVLIGGVFESCKSFVYAYGFDFNSHINKLSYKHSFDIIIDNYNSSSPSDLRYAASFFNDYGLSFVRQIKPIDSKELEERRLDPGMYSVNFGYRMILIGVR